MTLYWMIGNWTFSLLNILDLSYFVTQTVASKQDLEKHNEPKNLMLVFYHMRLNRSFPF